MHYDTHWTEGPLGATMDTNELQRKCTDAELFLGKCVLGKEVHTMNQVAFLKGEGGDSNLQFL